MRRSKKFIVRRLYEEAFNEGHLEVIDELMTTLSVDHELFPPGSGKARDDLKLWLTTLREAFPDLHFTIEDIVAEGDRVAIRAVMTGTHMGSLAGIPPTGRPVRVETMDLIRFNDGAIAEHWGVADTAAMAAQLGVVA